MVKGYIFAFNELLYATSQIEPNPIRKLSLLNDNDDRIYI